MCVCDSKIHHVMMFLLMHFHRSDGTAGIPGNRAITTQLLLISLDACVIRNRWIRPGVNDLFLSERLYSTIMQSTQSLCEDLALAMRIMHQTRIKLSPANTTFGMTASK